MVDGQIQVRPGSNKYWKVHGKWTESMSAFNEETGEEIILWKSSKLPVNTEYMYHFTHFGINLNHLPPSLECLLAPTDSRFRPDQRALEHQDTDLAAAEKLRLEKI